MVVVSAVLSLLPAASSWAQRGVASDRAALVALYEAMDGANWGRGANHNWLSDRPLAEWYGVETDANDRVTSIQLVDLDIYGTGICVPDAWAAENWAPSGRFDSSGRVCGQAPDAETVVDLAFFWSEKARLAAYGCGSRSS